MGIYQGLSEYKPDAQASAAILAYTRLRFGLVLVRNYLPLAKNNLTGGRVIFGNRYVDYIIGELISNLLQDTRFS